MITGHARIAVIAAAVIATAAGFLLLRTFDPSAPGSPFPPCVFHALTGLYCPGCGLTRMLHALAYGDLSRALRMNAMVLAMLPALAVIAINELGTRRMVSGLAARLLYNGWLWLGVVVAFGVLRNLPWAPFRALAPG